jgi:uncharacterized peroxidase-related enzyme
MAVIRTVPENEATGETAAFYAQDILDVGYVPSHTKVMALHPEAFRAWQALVKAVSGPMDKRRYELVTLAAALGIESKHCRLAHGAKTLRYIDEPSLIRIARDYRNAGLSPAEVAMMEFAEKVSRNSASMTDDDAGRLRDFGFNDHEILEISLAAGLRNLFSRVLQSLNVDVDVPPALTPELQNALLEPLTAFTPG